MTEIKWLDIPEEHDYPAAESYLSLIYNWNEINNEITGITKKLKSSPVVKFKAKDIFRASGLSLLDGKNSHVHKDIKKIDNGEKLSPLLLVRDTNNGKVVIADGYHRLCAVYSYDEDAIIPCKIF